MIADSVPVAFGTLALPLTALSTTTGLPLSQLGAMVGRQTPLLALLVPFVLLFVIGGAADDPEITEERDGRANCRRLLSAVDRMLGNILSPRGLIGTEVWEE